MAGAGDTRRSLEVLSGVLSVKRPGLLVKKILERQWCILYHGYGTLSARIDVHERDPKMTESPCRRTIYIEEASWKKLATLEPAFSFEVKGGKQWVFYCATSPQRRDWVMTLCCISKDLCNTRSVVGLASEEGFSGPRDVGYENVQEREAQEFYVLADEIQGCLQQGWSGVFKLRIGNGQIRLLKTTGHGEELMKWEIKDLANYGSSTQTIVLRYGKRSATGESRFTFRTTESSLISESIYLETKLIPHWTRRPSVPFQPVLSPVEIGQISGQDGVNLKDVQQTGLEPSGTRIVLVATPKTGHLIDQAKTTHVSPREERTPLDLQATLAKEFAHKPPNLSAISPSNEAGSKSDSEAAISPSPAPLGTQVFPKPLDTAPIENDKAPEQKSPSKPPPSPGFWNIRVRRSTKRREDEEERKKKEEEEKMKKEEEEKKRKEEEERKKKEKEKERKKKEEEGKMKKDGEGKKKKEEEERKKKEKEEKKKREEEEKKRKEGEARRKKEEADKKKKEAEEKKKREEEEKKAKKIEKDGQKQLNKVKGEENANANASRMPKFVGDYVSVGEFPLPKDGETDGEGESERDSDIYNTPWDTSFSLPTLIAKERLASASQAATSPDNKDDDDDDGDDNAIYATPIKPSEPKSAVVVKETTNEDADFMAEGPPPDIIPPIWEQNRISNGGTRQDSAAPDGTGNMYDNGSPPNLVGSSRCSSDSFGTANVYQSISL